MLIDGNDERGIDVGIMTKNGYAIASMLSHVDDKDGSGLIFSRDCAAYTIKTPKGHSLFVLVNHFKSQRFGDAATDAKRLRQATRVKAIYEGLVHSGHKFVAVVGDLNVEPTSNTLAPLLADTDLKDIGTHPAFDDGGGAHAPRPGTFKTGTAHDKLDYILLSPAMWAKTKRGGIFRKGVFTTLFEHYPEITKASEAASDHSPIWAEIDV
jgi:endonuclease/exonuclease/phosphatase family metal-dependent hydrolase